MAMTAAACHACMQHVTAGPLLIVLCSMQAQQQRPWAWQRQRWRRRKPGQWEQRQRRDAEPAGGGCIAACASGRLGSHTGELAQWSVKLVIAQPPGGREQSCKCCCQLLCVHSAYPALQLLAAVRRSNTKSSCCNLRHQHAISIWWKVPSCFSLQVMNSAVSPEVESVPASVGEVFIAAAGLAATGVVAWSLATLKDTGRLL